MVYVILAIFSTLKKALSDVACHFRFSLVDLHTINIARCFWSPVYTTPQSPAILDLRLRKPRAAESGDYRDLIEKYRLQNVFRAH